MSRFASQQCSNNLRNIQNTRKQAAAFMPFDALSGYSEQIARVQHPKETRRLLAADELAHISQVLSCLTEGDRIDVCRFLRGRYVRNRGIVTRVDAQTQLLYMQSIADAPRITVWFCDIYSLELV